MNERAVYLCLGPHAKDLSEVARDQQVACSGVLFGTPKGFGTLARLITTYYCNVDKMSDQAVLNYLLFSGKLADAGLSVEVQPAGTGIVNTIGSYKDNASDWVDAHVRDGVVLNDDGEP